MDLGSNLHCVCAVWEPTPWGKKKKKPKDGSQGGAAPGPPAKSKIISIWKNVATP